MVVRFGMDVARVGWMCVRRFRASRRVRRRGKYGKFEREEMSLSVKSMASWSCVVGERISSMFSSTLTSID